jgi:hypothetical protein
LPYNLLLHRDAREALNIDLTDQVVVIDEAHSKCFAMQASQALRTLHRFKRPYIVVTFVIDCHPATGYPKPLFGTAVGVRIEVQEQISVKTCASLEASVPPSLHVEETAFKLAATKYN